MLTVSMKHNMGASETDTLNLRSVSKCAVQHTLSQAISVAGEANQQVGIVDADKLSSP